MGSNTNTLTKQQASKLLKDLIKDESCFLQVSAGAEKGDGLLSSITKVTIKTNDELLHLVIKLAGDNEAMRKMIAVRTIFCREIHFYDTILPAFISLQSERNVSEPFNSVARCFKTCNEVKREMLALEDIRQQGFELWNVKKSLMDQDHMIIILKEYAKLHALSFAMQDHNNDLYVELTKDLDEIWNKINEKFIYEVLSAADKVKNLYDSNSNIYNTLEHFNAGIAGFIAMLETTTLKYNAILHGDCWCNNLMFKYSENKPVEMKILDFQMIRVSSPVLDISYVLYTNGSKETYTNLNKYLNIYYKTFSDHLETMGSCAEKLYPLEALKNDWKNYSRFGYINSLIAMRLALVDKDEMVDIMDVVDSGNSVSDVFNKSIKNDNVVNERLKDLAQHMCDNGYLN